jgi:hypothetical protein
MAKAKPNPAIEVKEKYPQTITIDNNIYRLVDFQNELSFKQQRVLRKLVTPLIPLAIEANGAKTVNIGLELLEAIESNLIEILAALYINADEPYFNEITYKERIEIFSNQNAKMFAFGGGLIMDFLPSSMNAILGDFQTYSAMK